MVEKDDVMDAISSFVAAYLVQLPEAQHLKPDELQRALGGAIAVRAYFFHSFGKGQHLRQGACVPYARIFGSLAATLVVGVQSSNVQTRLQGEQEGL